MENTQTEYSIRFLCWGGGPPYHAISSVWVSLDEIHVNGWAKKEKEEQVKCWEGGSEVVSDNPSPPDLPY